MTFKPFLVVACLVSAFLFSCADNKESTTTQTLANDTSVPVTTTGPAAQSLIDTAPAHILLIKSRVADFSAWKLSYDARDSARRASGMHNYVVARGVEDSNLVQVALKADDMSKAKAFAGSAGLRKAMKDGGMTGTPSFGFVTWVFQDNSLVSTPIRSMTSFMVKDWDTWQRAFKEGRQERLDNGIIERAYGYDPDNNKKVTLVIAIIDSAKAAAFWKSDLLKKRRTASGVVSEPERLLIRIVQRY